MSIVRKFFGGARHKSQGLQPASPPLWSNIDSGYVNPYVCRTLVRIDAMLYRLKGKDVFWGGPRDGGLYERMPKGHGVELRSHFPEWMFVRAADVQNKHFWTRKVLSA